MKTNFVIRILLRVATVFVTGLIKGTLSSTYYIMVAPGGYCSPHIGDHASKRHKHTDLRYSVVNNRIYKALSVFIQKIALSYALFCGREYVINNVLWKFSAEGVVELAIEGLWMNILA
jgi:hypothetical protein